MATDAVSGGPDTSGKVSGAERCAKRSTEEEDDDDEDQDDDDDVGGSASAAWSVLWAFWTAILNIARFRITALGLVKGD